MELDHIFDPEHTHTFEELVKCNVEGVVCAACSDEISSEHYSCLGCKFFLHKLCAQQPLELTHEWHPKHPLRLLQESPYDCPAYCDSCSMEINGFVYHCGICNFDLDFICAISDELKVIHVGHPRHGLTYEKVVKKADKGVVCAACLAEITGPLANYYSCRTCNFFLHKLCSQRPVELTRSLHPQHPLRLCIKDPHEPGEAFCGGCKKPMKGFVYNCSLCSDFCLDFKCAFPKLPSNRIQNFEKLHRHPLTFQPRPAKFSCDLCSSTGGEEDMKDQSYSCSICNFWIHLSCALAALSQLGHPHKLSRVLGVPRDLQLYDGFSCDVCHSTVSPEDEVFHCARCRYFVHLRCMTTDDTYLISYNKDAVDYLDDSFFKYLLKDDEFLVVDWPPKDVSTELIQPFLLRKILMDVQPKIRHIIHKQHEMILFKELAVNNDNFFEEEDEEILCDACIHPITAPYYSCQECNYFLHLACANLPSHIKHSSHSHVLKLTYHMRCYKWFRCDLCQVNCNGLSYQCQTCNFALDLICAALPAFMMHETHEHPLIQMTANDEALCYACGKNEVDGTIIFKCVFCNVYLHYDCAMYSEHIRHRWDRHHPLVLRFPPHADHPDHFMCDVCEELIHPTRWLYSCFQCDVSFHTLCAPRYEKFPNIKYGGKVQISSHQHILQYLRKATLRNTCDKCEFHVEFNVFECETCYDCFCYSCARCMIPGDTYLSSITDAVDYLDDSFFKHIFMDDEYAILQWLPRDISSELIQSFLLEKRGIVMDGQPKIHHFSHDHEQHDMILFEEQTVNNDKFFEEEDEEILCDACIHPITAPYYCCQDCNYFLHLACANLPSQIKHFSHLHELELDYGGKFYKFFFCARCKEGCNGFRYCCKTCDFALDLTCAALPAAIMHETHEHPLFQMTPEDEARCYACGRIENDGAIIFKCTFCDVYLHYYCAMLSRHIRHRWDRHHPLLLRFPPHADHPGHSKCDMCKELIHPMHWLYSCFHCDVSFHTRCAPRYAKYPNIKYGGKVQISFHHHILQYLRMATLKTTCDKCEDKLVKDDVFECETCYDCFCYRCVTSELRN